MIRRLAEAIARQPSRCLDAEVVVETIAIALPQENHERTFTALISWARSGDLFAYDEIARVVSAR